MVEVVPVPAAAHQRIGRRAGFDLVVANFSHIRSGKSRNRHDAPAIEQPIVMDLTFPHIIAQDASTGNAGVISAKLSNYLVVINVEIFGSCEVDTGRRRIENEILRNLAIDTTGRRTSSRPVTS